MAFLGFIDRVIIPAVMVIVIVGGISGMLLGCARRAGLSGRKSATLRARLRGVNGRALCGLMRM